MSVGCYTQVTRRRQCCTWFALANVLLRPLLLLAGCKSGQRVLNLTQMAVSLGTDITSRRLCPVCMRLQDVIARVLSLDGEKVQDLSYSAMVTIVAQWLASARV